MYERKTKDVFVLEVDYGYGDGWEYVLEEDTKLEANKRLKEYRENCPQYSARIRKRRVPLK